MSILISLLLANAAFPQTVDIGSRRELFLDHHVIDKLQGARLQLHHPWNAGSVLKMDEPWEGAFCGYFTVIHDQNRYRLYYRGVPNAGKDGRGDEVTCYAESADGIHWTKPRLRIHEVNGSRENNIILANQTPFSHNFAPFLDTRAGVPASERFKAIAGLSTTGLVAFASADGIHWRKLREDPIVPKGPARFDSQNLAFWSEAEQMYVCYFRIFKQIGDQRYRWIARTTSKDFLNWSEAKEMSFGDTPPEHLYTNQTSPYFRAPHLYISIAARFFPGRQILSNEEARAIKVDPGYFKDVSDAVLFTSRGGNKYDRTFLEAFLRPGLGMENWVSRTNYPAWNVVQTGPEVMSLYVNKNYGQPSAYLARYVMRLDGFASLHADVPKAECLTKPLIFLGKAMELNVATSAGGSVKVELLALDGSVLRESEEVIGDSISRTVRWKNAIDLSNFEGKPVRIRFTMRDADLFSFRFF